MNGANTSGTLYPCLAFSSIIGPFLGGIITQHLSWRWVFFVNIPIGIASFIIILAEFESLSDDHKKISIDIAGNILFLCMLVPLMIGLSIAGRDYPWGSPLNHCHAYRSSCADWSFYFCREKSV